MLNGFITEPVKNARMVYRRQSSLGEHTVSMVYLTNTIQYNTNLLIASGLWPITIYKYKNTFVYIHVLVHGHSVKYYFIDADYRLESLCSLCAFPWHDTKIKQV